MDFLARLRAAMEQNSLAALLLNDLPSVTWLTGFTGTAGRVLLTQDDAAFITDSRYAIQASHEVSNMPTKSFASPTDADEFLSEQARQMGIAELAISRTSITVAAFEALAAKLSPIKLIPSDGLIEKLRMLKSEQEIAKLRIACRFADETFRYMLDRVQLGRSEREINLDLEFFIRRQGHELAFPPIVVSGENSARPHGHASDRVLQTGDFVTMDFGANIDGYNSDITRTVVVGKADQRHREVYEQVLKAQLAALAAIRPGVAAAEVDSLARTVLDELGLAQYFGHGLGHGLGRLVHDSGRLSRTSADRFEPGQVWTVEPGVYLEGFGGVRIEDDLVVTQDGIELLTHSPKDLLELPLR